MRTLFDNSSSEWEQSTIGTKRELFGKLIASQRPLQSWIDGYYDYYAYDVANKSHVLNRLPGTLLELQQSFGGEHRSILSDAILCFSSLDREDLAHAHSLFKSASEVKQLVEESLQGDDNTREILRHFEDLKASRSPFYLELSDLELILKWKLGRQKGRQKAFRTLNTDENVITITQAAFSVRHADEDYETSLRLKLLLALAGVEIPVASAILTLCFPDDYSVIDFRNWRQIYPLKAEKSGYTFNDYNRYLHAVKSLALRFDTTPQQIDIAIWQKDRKANKR